MTATQTEVSEEHAVGEATGVLVVDHTSGGTRARYVRAFCAQLAEQDISITALVPRSAQTHDPGAFPVLPWLRGSSGRPLFMRVVLEIFNVLALLVGLHRSGAQVVVIQAGAPRRVDPLIVRILHFTHRRVVWAAHELVRPPVSQTTIPRATRKLYKRADAVVVFSQAAAGRFVQAAPETIDHVWIIPYGDPGYLADSFEEPAEVRRKLGVSGRVPVALCHTEEADDAGVLDFVDAAATLRDRNVHIECVIGGVISSQLRRRLAQQLRASRLEGSVRLCTQGSWDGTRDELFAAADVVVVPYRDTTESLLPGLAAVHGRPVVVTDVGGVPETVEGRTGEIARAHDPASMADALVRVISPRRQLQQRQWDLRRHPVAGASWETVVAEYLPALALGETREGRRLAVAESRKAVGWVWGTVLAISLLMLIGAAAKGIELQNMAFLAAVALPAGLIFLFVVPLEQKIIFYFASFILVELVKRVAHYPLQVFMPILLGLILVHLLVQPPKDPLKLKGTRFLHVLIMLNAGWAVTEVFNPNVWLMVPALRSIRLILEPIVLYVALICYIRDSRTLRRFLYAYLAIGTLAILWGAKIALVGYFGFEEEWLALTGQRLTFAESRNIGTMDNPMIWGMYTTSLVLICFALLMEGKRAFRHRWFLMFMIPVAALNTVSTGQRIQFVGLVVSLPVVLAASLASRGTRLRAVIALVVGAMIAVMVWNWIPENSGGRKGLESKTPIEAARQKLGAIKNPEVGKDVAEERLTNAGPTVEAVFEHPLGGGTGLGYVSGFGTKSMQSGSIMGGTSGADSTRARNVIPTHAGDYFYVNWMAERGIPGLILIGLLFLLAIGWSLAAYNRCRHPAHRALAIAGAGWTSALIVNNLTNGAFFSPQTSSLFFMFLAFAVLMPAIEEREGGEPTTETETQALDIYT